MSSSDSSRSSASQAARTFFSKTHVIYIFNFVQNLILTAVVTAITVSMTGGKPLANLGPVLGNVTVPLDQPVPLQYGGMVKLLSHSFPGASVYLFNAGVTTYSTTSLKDFIGWAQPYFDEVTYKLESFDCDDYALALAGLNRLWFEHYNVTPSFGSAFGVATGWIGFDGDPVSGHAMNIFIDNTSKVWFVEPQTMNIYSSHRLTNDSSVEFILI